MPAKQEVCPEGTHLVRSLPRWQARFKDSDFIPSKQLGNINRRALSMWQDEDTRDIFYLDHTARVYGGNSGGPLVSEGCQVVGINTAARQRVKVRVNASGQKEKDVEDMAEFNYALGLAQLRRELDKHDLGIVWQLLAR